MLNVIAKKLFGTQNERELALITPLVSKINSLEAATKALSNDQLKAKTAEFKERVSRGETLDALLPEAFAVVREAGWRVLGQRHYDVQMIGGTVLHRGKIAEMRTGEGKTLVSTLPSYLNALSGKGVHIVTVNDYLARRDSEWMGRLHNFLGLTVGVVVHGVGDLERKKNYRCDITYGTNSEFGFDYLRDNMKFSLDDYVQRELNYAIVDEVDSIFIDEARTPLIISGPTDDSTDKYYAINRIIPKLDKSDYTVEEKSKSVALTDSGVEKIEKYLGVNNLYEPHNIELVHHVNQALKAHVIFKRDVDYVVKDGEIIIVDEFTGRLMAGRRWSDGLHQAVEAKEDVEIENENQTLATITYQNYFRMYSKLSGMTGTADTEAAEFKKIYNLDVVVVPTNRPMVRKDHADVIYKSIQSKYNAVVNELKTLHEKGQPVLVGTISIEKSELLSSLLKRAGVPHNVLNAKQHEREAEIVAQAGRRKMVTISTNMAGRGTDILLGGNPEFLAKQKVDPAASPEEYAKVLEQFKVQCAKEREEVMALGGLFILGTERHESRRIDNQLRGRAGRQGDPGESRFYLSLEDDLLRIFGSVNIGKYMEEDVPIEHRWITKAIENAQKKVEAHNFDIRKHLLEYDDVMNQQRKVVYAMRREVLAGHDLKPRVLGMIDEIADAVAQDFFPDRRKGSPAWDLAALNESATLTFRAPVSVGETDLPRILSAGDLSALIVKQVEAAYDEKEKQLGVAHDGSGQPVMRNLEKMVTLTTLDHLWKDHLLAMDHLREGINLRGYGQKDPLLEYKKEGYNYFQMMYGQISYDVVRKLFEIQVQREESLEEMAPKPQPMVFSHGGEPENAPRPQGSAPRAQATSATPRATTPDGDKIGRNDPCPCGSGKKYKKCHGA
ncbi:MAG TPA: preprotein translocase subunit SecA [Oligoflexia bacterium]|nr:preprotein translocase subunit SecA [Oligoflexia bacterium]